MAKDKMDENRLVLGVGNFSKSVLAACEPRFPDWAFAVLDFWSVAQEISFVEGERQVEENTLRFRRDLSFFVTEPKLAIRIGPDKYERSDTQKILRYTEDYRKSLRRAVRTNLEALISRLAGFTSIVVLTDASDEIALESFQILIPRLKNTGCELKVLSSFPPDFQGEIVAVYATTVTQMLSEVNVRHHQVLLQQLFEEAGDLQAKDLFGALQHRLSQELSTLLSCTC